MDGTITPEEILSRIPKGADTVYVKPEDNKAYWVKGEETDSVDLWKFCIDQNQSHHQNAAFP